MKALNYVPLYIKPFFFRAENIYDANMALIFSQRPHLHAHVALFDVVDIIKELDEDILLTNHETKKQDKFTLARNENLIQIELGSKIAT